MVRVRIMVFNSNFSNISVISWRSVLLVEETEVPGKNPPTCRKSLTNFIILCCIEYTSGFELTTLVVVGTDCISTCSYKSNYYTITTTATQNYLYHTSPKYYGLNSSTVLWMESETPLSNLRCLSVYQFMGKTSGENPEDKSSLGPVRSLLCFLERSYTRS